MPGGNVTTKICLAEECTAPSVSRGLCARCYSRIRRLGRIEEYPATISTARHSLSDVDTEGKTAICSVCGPTKIRVRKSRKSHECMTVRRRTPSSPPARRKAWLKQKYGLTPEEYDALLQIQDNACAICRTTDVGARSWHVDHDHACCPGRKSCGKCVRGVLCNLCNAGLGYFRDSTESMERAIGYLSK